MSAGLPAQSKQRWLQRVNGKSLEELLADQEPRKSAVSKSGKRERQRAPRIKKHRRRRKRGRDRKREAQSCSAESTFKTPKDSEVRTNVEPWLTARLTARQSVARSALFALNQLTKQNLHRVSKSFWTSLAPDFLRQAEILEMIVVVVVKYPKQYDTPQRREHRHIVKLAAQFLQRIIFFWSNCWSSSDIGRCVSRGVIDGFLLILDECERTGIISAVRSLGSVSLISELGRMYVVKRQVLHIILTILVDHSDKPTTHEIWLAAKLIVLAGKDICAKAEDRQAMKVYSAKFQEILQTTLFSKLPFLRLDVCEASDFTRLCLLQ